MALGSLEFDIEEGLCDLPDWQLPIVFNHKRHTEKIEGNKTEAEVWRVERMKTVSVALVLCLNVGVDPPDVVKTQPCARMECWIDPLSLAPQKALEMIGANLQQQYERWQPRARYKQSLDPTVDEVKRLCTSLRRNAKDERVLFHYNGHGVPKPTSNGEIWVFNKSYTQYIPLSVYDLQQWMGAPSIYVYDCNCAGLIVESFKQFAIQHERGYEVVVANNNKGQTESPPPPPPPSYKSCIQLAACGPQQILPMNPDLPADLFTSCLTTPIKVALRWFVMQNTCKLLPEVTLDLIEKIPGQLNDRRTILGELNWIFTAITDTIAWNVLPKDLFQILFRQDLLVASLFRNFMLAERVMRSYNCSPVSNPAMPPTYHHPMWQAWDLAVDLCLSQLPSILKEEEPAFRHSSFFTEQLTAFQVWLSFGSEAHSPPEQLPIVLQVLLSQVHRLRALELLSRFVDLGPWAVNLALSVGIFPYVVRLLQSPARELRPLLVFIWAKVLAVDTELFQKHLTHKESPPDLVREGGHKYFLNALADTFMPAEHRSMAAFVMACVVRNHPNGQEAALQCNLISVCLEQLNDNCSRLRLWLAICLGLVWTNYDAARWCGVRDRAHEKLYNLLSDSIPEVRAAAVFALGTFLNSTTERTDHANIIDHNIGVTLINTVAADGSHLVRKELVVALQWLVMLFENQFIAVAYQFMEEEKRRETAPTQNLLMPDVANIGVGLRKVASRDRLKVSGSPVTGFLESSAQGDGVSVFAMERIRRVNSSTSLSSVTMSPGLTLGYASVFTNIWKALVTLSNDPHSEVAASAQILINTVKTKITEVRGVDTVKNGKHSSSSCYSEPSSPSGKPQFISDESPPSNTFSPQDTSKSGQTLNRWADSKPLFQQYQYFAQHTRSRKIFDKGPDVNQSKDPLDEGEEQTSEKPRVPLISTEFVEWCTRYFQQPVIKVSEDKDPESTVYLEKEWRFLRNAHIRKGLTDEQKRSETSRLDEQIFINRNPTKPTVLRFFPYEPYLVVTDKDCFSVWDLDKNVMLGYHSTGNPSLSRITAMEFINPHDVALLMIGSDDGAVKVWRNFLTEENPELVTGFLAVQDLSPSVRGSGVVLHWEQETSHLFASGDVRTIRIWDLEKEMKIADIPTGAECCVTCLSTMNSLPDLVAAGCGDGTVRVYDRRIPPTDSRVLVLQEHSGWVVNAFLQNRSDGKNRVISGSVAGDVRFWELPNSSSIRHIPPSHGMTSMAIHPSLDLIACGSASQSITVYNHNADFVNCIKYHDGFMGHRIGPISCLAFHPYRGNLAAGSTDSFISVYTIRRH